MFICRRPGPDPTWVRFQGSALVCDRCGARREVGATLGAAKAIEEFTERHRGCSEERNPSADWLHKGG